MSMLLPLEQHNALDITMGGYSSEGIKAVNGDAFAAHKPTAPSTIQIKGITACIADGASSSHGQQLASQTAVNHFIEDYYSTPDSWGVKKSAAKVLNALNIWLHHHAQCSEYLHQQHSHNKLLTTFSSIIFKPATAHILHVGDSRVYRIRNGSIELLTRDHHYHHRDRFLLNRGLGMDSRLDVDYFSESIQKKDIYVLSTDGLHRYLSDSDFIRLISANNSYRGSLDVLAKRCVQQAISNGSDDNASCLIVRIDSVDSSNTDGIYQQLSNLSIPPAMSVGNSIDHYQIKKILHSGSRSHVYLVNDTMSNRDCVLKAPSINFEGDWIYLEAFIREEWVGRRLNHSGILKITPRPEGSQFLYHISDFIEGDTLRQWMYDNPQPSFDLVRAIIKEIISALRVFQRKGMVHRDLKPENIMFDKSDNIKIIDFGAVQVDSLDEVVPAISDAIPLGAKDYLAPEYLRSNKACHTADIFSLGVIVYEMLTGELPFKSKRDDNYIAARTVRNNLPLWIDLALQKACHLDSVNRYQALSEFYRDLLVPNKQLIASFESKPLIERRPLLVWKLISLVLMLLLLIQLLID